MTITRSNGISVHVSSDEMSALLSISARADEFPSLETISVVIKAAGIIEGVDTFALRSIAEKKDPVHEFVIARGFEALPCEADKIIWSIEISDKNHPKIKTDGNADFKQLHHYQKVSAGEKILHVLPGYAEKNGMTVTGKSVAGETNYERIKVPVGKNTKLADDGLTLYAAIDGVAMIKDGEVVIDNIYHIHGDVDFSTGNVKYHGTVMIDGDVRSGFRVEATDSIYIHGSVEAAEIYSKNGSVIIKNGVLGRNRARILAGDDLNCRFIQDATASVKNNVVIKNYAINSNITSGGKILLIENEGLIRGGKTVAEKGIDLLVAGSERNILTELVLSRSDVGEDQSSLWRAKIRLAEQFQELDALMKRMEFLELLRGRLTSISAEREMELSKLKGGIGSAKNQLDKYRVEVEELEMTGSSQSPEHAVRIFERLYGKVTVTIGHKKYFSTPIKGRISIYRKGDELLVEPLA